MLRWFGSSLVRLVISAAMMLFVLAAWVSIMTLIIPHLIFDFNQNDLSNVTLWKAVLLCGICLFFLFVTTIVPFVVGAGAFVASGIGLARFGARLVPKGI
jgi:hypothetical protein